MERVGFSPSFVRMSQRLTPKDGFTVEEAHNATRVSCGITCVAAVLLQDGVALHGGLGALFRKAYAPEMYVEGVGWKHSALAQIAEMHGRPAAALDLKGDASRIVRLLQEGNVVIASVSRHLATDRKGGHLVLLTGVDLEGDVPLAFHILDPDDDGWTSPTVPTERLLASWTGRVIAIAPQTRHITTHHIAGPARGTEGIC